MLDLNFIENFARENNLPANKRRVIAEYLQTIILEIISNSKFNETIIFMGGTCLRFVYNIQRFSEDLDFDLNLIKKNSFNFNKFCAYLSQELKLQNFSVYIGQKENAILYRASVRFAKVLQQAGLSAFEDENLTINLEIDKDPSKNLITEAKIINHFNKSFPVLVNNKETLFAEKIKAALLRPFTKARDFYDLFYFFSDPNFQPNYAILKEKNLRISNLTELHKALKKKITQIGNLDLIIKDLKPYIFNSQQLNLIKKFLKSYIA